MTVTTDRKFTLYGYFRSSASARVRTVMALHEIPYTNHQVHLLRGEQRSKEYLAVNPSGTVPTLSITEADGSQWSVAQCVSIMEYLDEEYGGQSKVGYLLPRNARDRAMVRNIIGVLVSDLFPCLTSGTLKRLRSYGVDDAAWAKECSAAFVEALEGLLKRTSTSGKYCFGDSLTLADATFSPQMETVLRFAPDVLPNYPTVYSIYQHVSQLPQVVAADYKHQPDTPEELRAK